MHNLRPPWQVQSGLLRRQSWRVSPRLSPSSTSQVLSWLTYDRQRSWMNVLRGVSTGLSALPLPSAFGPSLHLVLRKRRQRATRTTFLLLVLRAATTAAASQNLVAEAAVAALLETHLEGT